MATTIAVASERATAVRQPGDREQMGFGSIRYSPRNAALSRATSTLAFLSAPPTIAASHSRLGASRARRVVKVINPA